MNEQPERHNIKLTLSWNGEKFSGYQRQPHAFTVQEALTQAWKVLARGEETSLCGCSRLDAGVHAQHYVLNFYTATFPKLDCASIVRGLNGILHSQMGLDISIAKAEQAPLDFHARFAAKGKHYRYLVWHGFGEHAFFTKRTWHVRSPVFPGQMTTILKQFEGRHDFSAFRSADCAARTTVRTVCLIDTWIHPLYPEMMIVDIWGEGFLKNMIRNMVGTAVEIAVGKRAETTIAEAFMHGDRKKIGMCAPPWPLTLMRVFYEESDFKTAIDLGCRHLIPC